MGRRLLRRRGLAAAGLLAAGVLSGCHSSMHFRHPGVIRGDLAESGPTVPVVAGKVPGRGWSVNPPPGGGVATGDFVHPVMNSAMPAAPVTEGAPVMPVGHTPGNPMPVQTASVPSMPTQSMTLQPAGAMPPFMPATPIHGIPVTMTTGTPTMPAPGTAGTPTLMLIQGPNGPQYVITEVYSAVPLPMPGMPQPLLPAPTPMPPATAPASAPVVMTCPVGPAAPPVPPAPPVPVMASPRPMPEPAPVPPVAPVAIPPAEPAAPVTPAPAPTLAPAPIPDPMPPAAPTFMAPPPATIPPPSPTAGVGIKGPDSLPRTVSMKPPAVESGVITAGGPKLPPATAAIDDDIPAAPVFLPVAK